MRIFTFAKVKIVLKLTFAKVKVTNCQSLAGGTLFVHFIVGSTRGIMKYNT